MTLLTKTNLLAMCLMLVLTACQTAPTTVEDLEDTPINNAQTELPESALMDVGIRVFSAAPISDEDRERGISEELRQAEGRFMAVHLRDTLQGTGHWGAVRVIPEQAESVELVVKGEIETSDGGELVVRVEALDASGETWFANSYERRVPLTAYTDFNEAEIFQDVYNRIANDLYEAKSRLSGDDIERIRRVAGLRFANSLAPTAFEGFLSQEDGIYAVQRLPAQDDPMFERVLSIREREHLMIDVINGYYDNLYAEMEPPYHDWRRLSAEETEALNEVKRRSIQRYVLGSALILGAIALEVFGGSTNTDSLTDAMVLGGAYTVKTGADLGAQKQLHKDAIKEMGESFQAEVAPMVVDVEGQTTEITGSAEEQFIKWRELLEQLYRTETEPPVPLIYRGEKPAADGEVAPPADTPAGDDAIVPSTS